MLVCCDGVCPWCLSRRQTFNVSTHLARDCPFPGKNADFHIEFAMPVPSSNSMVVCEFPNDISLGEVAIDVGTGPQQMLLPLFH